MAGGQTSGRMAAATTIDTSRNILHHDDIDTLAFLGAAIGLDAALVKNTLTSDAYTVEVKKDIEEAQYLGIRGVPFFVFNDKYGISGAQDVKVFVQTLEKSFSEWQKEKPQPVLTVIEGESCSTEGDCA